MAAEWCEDFERYDSTTQALQRPWAQLDDCAISTANPRTGAKHLRMIPGGSYTNNVARRVFAGNNALAGFEVGIYLPILPTAQGILSNTSDLKVCMFLAPTGDAQVMFAIATDGSIIAYQYYELSLGASAHAGAKLGQSAPRAVVAGAYNQLGFKVFHNTSTGLLEVRSNGVTVLALNDINTDPIGTGGATQVAFTGVSSLSGTFNVDYDDAHAWNGNAGQGPTDFVGNAGVVRRTLTADTSRADMAIVGGASGHAVLSDDNDSTGIEAANVGMRSEFVASTLPAEVTGIIYQQVNFRAEKTALGNCDVNVGFATPGSSPEETTLTGDQPMVETDQWYWGIVASEPSTGLPFTPAQANADHVVIERTL